MFDEDDLRPISALQHLAFCPRQCGLIHLEGLWAENRLTVEGSQLHDKAHHGEPETRPGLRVLRGVPVLSLELGLAGQADVVEFVGEDGPTHPPGQSPTDCPGGTPFPVEYKRGRPKGGDCDRVQLCAQALCLEATLGRPVPRGALFYARTRRREEVTFDEPLRRRTRELTSELHRLFDTGRTPQVPYQPKCRNCSLLELCMPGQTEPGHSATLYLQRSLSRLAPAGPQEDPDA